MYYMSSIFLDSVSRSFTLHQLLLKSTVVENVPNQDCRLDAKKISHSEICPDQSNLQKEIISHRQISCAKYANSLPPDFPMTLDNCYIYLGMTINQLNDRKSLQVKALMFRSKLKGPVDIILQNVKEFDNFLKAGCFTKAHLTGMVNAAYCLPGHLNIIYNSVCKKIQRQATETGMTLSAKIDSVYFPILLKLAKLYFMVQKLSIPCFGMEPEHLKNLDLYLVGFSYGSQDYSTMCLYIVSAHQYTAKSKVQLLMTTSKIQTYKLSDPILSVPQHKTYGVFQCSILLLKIAQIMQSLDLKVKAGLLFCDTISTLISIGQHPGNYKSPFRKWLAGINVNLYQLGLITGQQKQDIPWFINQRKRVNFADYMTKFDLTNDMPDLWLELQFCMLTPGWLLEHPRQWLDLVRLECRKN